VLAVGGFESGLTVIEVGDQHAMAAHADHADDKAAAKSGGGRGDDGDGEEHGQDGGREERPEEVRRGFRVLRTAGRCRQPGSSSGTLTASAEQSAGLIVLLCVNRWRRAGSHTRCSLVRCPSGHACSRRRL
jgi:hypothetical protein